MGAALVQKRRYWTSNIKGDEIDAHFAPKEVGNVDAVKQVEDRVAYHVFLMKDPDHVMKLMTTCGTLEPTDKRTRRNSNAVALLRQRSLCERRWLQIIFCIDIKLMTTTTGGMHPYPLRKLGLPNIGLIVAFLGTLPSQK